MGCGASARSCVDESKGPFYKLPKAFLREGLHQGPWAPGKAWHRELPGQSFSSVCPGVLLGHETGHGVGGSMPAPSRTEVAPVSAS